MKCNTNTKEQIGMLVKNTQHDEWVQDFLLKKARPYYPDTGSHGWDHILNVIWTAGILKGESLNVQELAAILFHDASVYNFGHNNHSIKSAEIASQELSTIFSSLELNTIIQAIREHSSEYRINTQSDFSSELSQLLAMADREYPVSIVELFTRDYLYQKENNPNFSKLTIKDLARHCLSFMRSKENNVRPVDAYWECFKKNLIYRKNTLFSMAEEEGIALMEQVKDELNAPLNPPEKGKDFLLFVSGLKFYSITRNSVVGAFEKKLLFIEKLKWLVLQKTSPIGNLAFFVLKKGSTQSPLQINKSEERDFDFLNFIFYSKKQYVIFNNESMCFEKDFTPAMNSLDELTLVCVFPTEEKSRGKYFVRDCNFAQTIWAVLNIHEKKIFINPKIFEKQNSPKSLLIR